MKTSYIRPILIAGTMTAVITAGCSEQKEKPKAPATPPVTAAPVTTVPPPVTVAPATTMAPASAAEAIDAAKAAIKAAKANNWIWRDTEKFLKKAEDAAVKGDEKTAMKMAIKARDQANTAMAQQNLEQGMDRSPK